ncbi:hypothetical protein [Halobaculum rarum]|uniref:hypothetical protein n=1 Tax=Halobaculum rarum TaxID=3075122 RepID=UPI0032AF06F6
MHRRPRHAGRGDAFVAAVTPAPGPSPTTRPRCVTTVEAIEKTGGRSTEEASEGSTEATT